MPSYKLTYFNVTALGEPIRMLLKYGNIDFEDVRVEKDDWPALKDKMPLGQMPILEVDGKVMYQSGAICRYLATKVGLAGSNECENYQIDNVVETMNDFRSKIAAWFYEADEKAKAEKKKFYDDNKTEEYFLSRLDAIAKENNGFMAAKKSTWADFWFIGTFGYMNFMAGHELISAYPNLKKAYENTIAIPQIKKWIETRPQSYA